jgi:hypothetical protein
MDWSQAPECSQTRISNILKFQEEGTQIAWPRHPLTQKQKKKRNVIAEELACG